MAKPIVAIVGRPNVGKSTLFNMLVGERLSIVKDTPGVTRDRIYADVNWLNYHFTLMDTGGIEPETNNQMLRHMREQAEMAIEMADVVMFVVDVKQGVVDADYKVAEMLRKAQKKIVLVVNKVDNFDKLMPDVYEFYNLGLGDPYPISSIGKLGIGDMLDEVTALFPENEDDAEDERPRIAIVGKPNAGKSSIINKLLGENRVIVSDVAGTTRDAVDTAVKWNGKEYVLAHGNVSGHKRLIDTMHIHTSEIQSITINKNTEELIIATRNTEYYCPLEYCKWEQQDKNADLIPEYNWIKKHYRKKLDIPEIDEDKVLLTLSNFDKYYYHSAYCKLSSKQEPVSFRAYPHIGMLQDSFTISGDGSLIKLSYFPHPKNIQFYCESTAKMPLFVENIGSDILYVDTHSGLIKLVPGERKEVKVENVEQEEQLLPSCDLYPVEIIE